MKPSENARTAKFVIRDDDLCFFSKPDHITAIYDEAFARNIPVSFSAIPMIMFPNDAWLPRPLPVPDDSGSFLISENRELVDYVASNPLIEITQHGYTHQTPNGIFEYAQSIDLRDATMQGKEILEQTFGKPITVFVAPHDQFSSQGIAAIEHAGLNILRGKGTRNFSLRPSSIMAFMKMIAHRLRFVRMSSVAMPAYPYAIRNGNHYEAFCMRIEFGRDVLMNALHYAHRTGGNFVLVNHIHDFTDEKKQLMMELIGEAEKLGMEFVPAGKLFDC